MSTTVFRVEKSREYVVMNNKFLRNKEMSLKAKGLLALCLSLPDDWNYSLNGLCAIVKESQTAVRSTLKELEKFGHLTRSRQQDKKGQFVYEYVLYESPHIGFRYADNQYADVRYTENNIQQSIEEQSIKKPSIEDKFIYRESDELTSILEEQVKQEDLRELYKEYIKMRQEINAPMSPRGLKMLITRCDRLSNMNIRVQKLMLESATINNWKSVYLPKEEEIKAENKQVLEELKSFYES